MKNRMREIRTSGSVRGEEGNLLPYSTPGGAGWDGTWGTWAVGISPRSSPLRPLVDSGGRGGYHFAATVHPRAKESGSGGWQELPNAE